MGHEGTLVSAAIRDVTDRKQAQVAVREAEELFRRAFDEAPIGMAMLDLGLGFVQVNDALVRDHGLLARAAAGDHFEAITHPDDLGSRSGRSRLCLPGGVGLQVREALRSR